MTENLKRTVRIARGSKVKTDERGRSVWAGDVEEAELELVSTQMLKELLTSENIVDMQNLRDAADSKDGVLAQNAQNGEFEIIDDDDLMSALESADNAPDTARAADATYEPLKDMVDNEDEELALVSTQALRQILQKDTRSNDGSTDQPGDAPDDEDPSSGGFDPYNSA